MSKPNYSFEKRQKEMAKKKKKKSNADWRNKKILSKKMRTYLLLLKINPFAKNECNYESLVAFRTFS